MKKLKIVFVIENYLPHVGGVEILFMNITERLAKNHDVHIITHRLKDTQKEEIINNVKIHRVSVPHFWSRYFFTFVSVPTIWKYTKNADIIHTTTYNGAPPAWLVGKLKNIPICITIHEVIGDYWKTLPNMSHIQATVHEFLEELVIKLPYDKYIGISYSTQTDFYKKSKKHMEVIYCGIDQKTWNLEKKIVPKKIKDIFKHTYNTLFFGRPGPSKGFEDLIAAMHHIKEENSKHKKDIHLYAIVSKDPAYKVRYDATIKEIKQNNLPVTILNPVAYKELPLYLTCANCVIVPSRTEGFGFSVAESCALGKTVVATDTKSIPEVISGSYVLVEPKNPKSLAEGIVKAYQGKVIKTPIKKFSWETCVAKYEKMYSMILNKK